MREVALYINDTRVDLFNDEQIQVTSSSQNIQDISKVFTDFSQTFTVPASPNNNAIFDHYYNNDVDGTFLAKERQPARIEINYTPFRRGKIQLEGAELKDGEAYAYKVTFYGDVVTLKDLFGDDKLKDLDYSGINFELTGANVQSSITGTSDQDVRFPLISSDRVWSYGDAASTDVSVVGNAIVYTELFPALKVSKIFELIESKYGLTFNGNFLSNKRFTNLYTWWKNKEDASFTSESIDLQFNLGDTSCSANFPDAVGISEINIDYVDLSTYPEPVNFDSWGNIIRHDIILYVYNTSTNDTYYIDCYLDGALHHTREASGDFLFTQPSPNGGIVSRTNTFGLNETWTFKIRSDAQFTFDFDIKYRFVYNYLSTLGVYLAGVEECSFTTTSVSTSNYIDFNTTAPDMRIDEYFSGVLKMFNMTCYPMETALNYKIEPLEDWYAYGDTIDITKYTDVDSIKVDRPKLYKEIEFKWKESKSFMNEAYKDANNRQFGGLREYFGYDGGEFKIELPFETLNFNKFTGENLQVAYSLTKEPDYKPYIPAPVMLYLYENQTSNVDFYFNDGSTNNQLTNYMPFGQEIQHNSGDYSISFNEEISSLTLDPVTKSLYMTYYYTYLKNLFSDKTRIVTVKTILPVRLLDYLELNDALVIRDKKYRINDMRSNLTTGAVELVLINDLQSRRRRLVGDPINPPIPNTGGVTVVPVSPVKPSKGGYVVVSDPGGGFSTPSETLPYTFTDDGTISFTTPSNGTGVDRTEKWLFEFYDPNGNKVGEENIFITQKGTAGFLLNDSTSYIILETLDYIEV
jgi:hypothetical protein